MTSAGCPDDYHALVPRMQDAVTQQAFEPFYQPIHHADGRVKAVEVLARWSGADGAALPDVFLPLAQHLKLDAAIDRQVHRKAIMGFLDVQQGHPDVYMSLNVCASILRDPPALREWIALISPALHPAVIEVEIVETVSLDGVVGSSMDALRAAGFRVALDDFGVGNAGLTAVIEHHFDTIKLDQRMIRQCTDPRVQRLIAHAVALAHDANAQVVAEGVETNAQRLACQDAGVDAIQGFYWSPALDLDRLLTYLGQHCANTSA